MNIAGHAAKFDAQGRLSPWTSWNTALERELQFYQQCPADRGYPRFVLATFLDADWTPIADRTDTIPATQNGMGILSYLKYHELRGYARTGLSADRAFHGRLPGARITDARAAENTRHSRAPPASEISFRSPKTAGRKPTARMRSSPTRAASRAMPWRCSPTRRTMPSTWRRHCRTRGFSRSISRTATRPGHPGRFGSTIAAARPAGLSPAT